MQSSSHTSPDLVLPEASNLSRARESIHTHLPQAGIGSVEIGLHLQNDICPGLNQSSQSSRYYGFVTGGSTAAAQIADNIVTKFDQNVAVHLPEETIATNVEHQALNMLCELLDFVPNEWPHKTFTTGATASNVVGLACGREHVVAEGAQRLGARASVAELGLMQAMRAAELDDVQVLTTVPHSSILKAASVIGLGHASVKNVSNSDHPTEFDMKALEHALQKPGMASIVMVACSEVNTGLFATNERREMEQIRALADQYHAWVHVDAAFGLMSRVLPKTAEYEKLTCGVAGVELADSITGDAHKLLNVPYDCGFILSKSSALATQVFQNPNAAYLNGPASSIQSPLNIGIENSRRFRALPVYANLVAYGREGYSKMLQRQIQLARRIASYILDSDAYELLPNSNATQDKRLADVFIIVLFRAKDEKLNSELVVRINASRKIYCSGTAWEGRPAGRFAISNWNASIERDWPVIEEVLDAVAQRT